MCLADIYKGREAFSEARIITFNTNILQLSDALTPLTGVCCTCCVGKESHVKVQDCYLPSF
jgi:hypothetical protein